MPLTRKVYEDRNQKTFDFVIGLVGWFVLNGICYTALFVAAVSFNLTDGNMAALLLGALPLLLNIVALILLGFTRYWIALGALAAFAISLVAVIVLGMLFYVICWQPLNP